MIFQPPLFSFLVLCTEQGVFQWKLLLRPQSHAAETSGPKLPTQTWTTTTGSSPAPESPWGLKFLSLASQAVMPKNANGHTDENSPGKRHRCLWLRGDFDAKAQPWGGLLAGPFLLWLHWGSPVQCFSPPQQLCLGVWRWDCLTQELKSKVNSAWRHEIEVLNQFPPCQVGQLF